MRSCRNPRASTSENNPRDLDSQEVSPSPQGVGESGSGPSKRSLRGRSGCLNCRRRRKKCDESKPSCAKCRRLDEVCEWDSGLSFRLSCLSADHPSMMAGNTAAASGSVLQIVDVTFDSITHQCKELLNGQELVTAESNVEYGNSIPADQQGNAALLWEPEGATGNGQTLSNSQTPLVAAHTHEMISPVSSQFGRLDAQTTDTANVHQSHRFDLGDDETQRNVTFQNSLSSVDNTVSAVTMPTIREDDHLLSRSLAELEPLDYLTDRDAFQGFGDSLWPPLSNRRASSIMDADHVLAESPDTYAMYYPNATYRQLHTTLYNHMVETARGTGLTRTGTPESDKPQHNALNRDTSTHVSQWEQPQPESSTPINLPKGMTARREIELWRNYLDEIALWLDMFDNDRHFQVHLPLLAQSSEPLRFSVLALSARQIERRDPDKPYTESLGLYQEAIGLVARELEGMSTAVITSCVLLCVLEMMSSSPRDWARHLDGCAMLIKAAGINGVVGGMRQAVFWCFARMDMWGGFLSDSHPKIPTSLWFLPTGSMLTAISRFKTDFQNFDSYANYSLFLCASVLNVISNRGGQAERGSSYTAKWKALFELLEDWHTNRPQEMRPLTPRASANGDNGDEPFPVVLYTNSPAVSANQLYHTATLLMLQAKPSDVRLRGQRSIFWHARQVIGISVSNRGHGAWTNALQPVYFAGKVMSSKIEHCIILELLSDIEKGTGFATQWRAQDLREYWGDEAE